MRDYALSRSDLTLAGIADVALGEGSIGDMTREQAIDACAAAIASISAMAAAARG